MGGHSGEIFERWQDQWDTLDIMKQENKTKQNQRSGAGGKVGKTIKVIYMKNFFGYLGQILMELRVNLIVLKATLTLSDMAPGRCAPACMGTLYFFTKSLNNCFQTVYSCRWVFLTIQKKSWPNCFEIG